MSQHQNKVILIQYREKNNNKNQIEKRTYDVKKKKKNGKIRKKLEKKEEKHRNGRR